VITPWAGGSGGLPSPEEARSEAESILGGRRFQPLETPRPLRGLLEWLGDRLAPVGDFLSGIADWIADRGGSPVGLVVIAAALAALAALVAVRAVRQRSTAVETTRTDSTGEPLSPGALEDAADEAERDGDYDRALRLRFRAGLLRLDTVGAIRFRPSITSGEVARAVSQDDFRVLAGDFDEVVYGGRPAGHDDVDAARTRWPRVWTTAGKRHRVEHADTPGRDRDTGAAEVPR